MSWRVGNGPSGGEVMPGTAVKRRALRRLIPTLLVTLVVAGCSEGGRVVMTTVSPELGINTPVQPNATFTPTALSASPTSFSPTATPASTSPSAMATSTPPPTAAPIPIPPSAMPTSTRLPTASATLAPTVTPTPVAIRSDPASIVVELQRIVSDLDTPVGIANAGDGSGRLFVLEKVGRIRVVQNGVLAPAPFLDIADRVGSSQNEQGLLGLAFHPNYANNGHLFVNYTDHQGDTVVSRFSVSSDPAKADPASEEVLLTLDQPAGNHNGGCLAFGSDGYLYIGTGDGGGAGDQFGNGQNRQTLLGAMLRLDVNRDQPYAVPGDNPFVDNAAVRDEIWAFGLRNPWRFSFDRLTGDLYIADVGQNMYEEVNFQSATSLGGENYGWPIMEGLHCFPADRICDRAGLTLPVREYDHTQGCSVTGGYVYRGQEFPFLDGIYLFGDYCSGRIWGLASSGGEWQLARLAQANVRISSFGEDETGELYLLDIAGGALLRITARPKSTN